MRKFDEKTITGCVDAIEGLINEIQNLESINFSDFKPDNTALIVVDVINGFIREGAMASSQIESVISPIEKLMKSCNAVDIPIIAFADCHKDGCAEFNSFPPHCIDKTSESELVDELKKVGGYFLMKKNSTNGFHEKDFLQCLIQNPNTNTFIVTGDCTDICVLQLCLSLQTWYNQQNKKVKIIVPANCVETYDAPYHNSYLMNIASYKLMIDSGVKFVSEIV